MGQEHRREFLVAAGLLLAAPFASLAQQHSRIWRVGYLSPIRSGTPAYGAFRRGMHDLGYVEGKNLVIESRFADGKYERLPDFAAELVALNPDVIVAVSSAAIRAARQATGTIPIVMPSTSDAVVSGFVASLARPGGNVTGLTTANSDTSAKLFEFGMILIPRMARIAVLVNPGSSSHLAKYNSIQTAAQHIGVNVARVDARTAEEIERGFVKIAREHATAIIVASDVFFFGQRHQIAELSLKHRLPTIQASRESTVAGGLLSYGADTNDLFRRAATYVDKILKGSKPEDLPVEQPTKFELVINLKTAKALGLTIPKELLLRADELIE